VKPSTSTWTSWAGSGNDLRVKKLNLGPLFHQVILINHDVVNSAYFSIDSTNAVVVSTSPRGLGWNAYYLDGTVLGLRDATATLKPVISFSATSASCSSPVRGMAASAVERVSTFGGKLRRAGSQFSTPRLAARRSTMAAPVRTASWS
jgi:hypothetical protein